VEMVHIAKQCGADGVKLQFFGDPKDLAARRGLGPEYAEVYAKYDVPAEWLAVLQETAHRLGLRFVVTVFRPEDAALVAKVADDLKVSSFEAEDADVLAAVAEARRPGQRVIVSLGMGKSVEPALALVGRDVLALHCVSAYPAPAQDLNLQRIQSQGLAGYSDHSGKTFTGGLAVACGAKLVEVHFRLDATDKANPDYPHSLPPHGLALYVADVRAAERMLGTGDNAAQESERPFVEMQEAAKSTGRGRKGRA
jgi:N,N'-diacetyllegionaminate synthase